MRLPNKIMLDLVGKPMIWHVIERCKMADVDEVIVATSINKENDIIEKFCKKNNYKFFRGSEDDVLARYYECAKNFELDIIIRVTADCPLISPKIINRVVKELVQQETDWFGNLGERSFFRGIDVEVFSFKALEKTYNLAKEQREREHVTEFMFNHPEIFKIGYLFADKGLEKLKRPDIRLTVDTPEDLKLMRIVYNNLHKNGGVDIYEVINFFEKNPELIKINSESEISMRKEYEGKQGFVEK